MAKKNKKLSSSIEQRRAKRNNADSSVKNNPFEVRINRLKHDVIGKKTAKNDKGLPGVARSKANEKRKKTLLKEYKQRNKSNQIIDRRFGEFDETLTAEEKMLKRFTLEKQSHHSKSGLYNMEDDDEEEMLTHYGQSLADINNFDDAGLKFTDDEEEDNTDDHFGGFLKKKTATDEFAEVGRDGDKKLSKQEVMDQIVANSKKKKYERQQTQEQAFELTQKLDTQWRDIQSLLIKTDHKKQKEEKEEKPDDYDKTVKALIFEAKAQATDKLKSEEQLAIEEKKRLETLEKERRMRMLGILTELDDDDEEKYVSADALVERKTKKVDDRYEVRYEDGKMVMPDGLQEIDDELGNNNMDESSEEEESEDDDDDAETDNDDIYSDEEEEEEEEINTKTKLSDKKLKDEQKKKSNKDKERKLKEVSEKAQKELPFTFDAPRDLKSFLKVVKDRNVDDVMLVLQRIKKCHNVKIDAKNKEKMQIFFDVILDYIEILCDDEKPPLKLVNSLTSFTYELITDIRQHATKSFQTRLKVIFNRISMRQKVKGNSGMFPTLKELIFFRVIALNFPTSDLNHVVTTPCMILMAMILHKGHLTNMKDVISSLYLLSIMHDFVNLSKRYIPEVICFIAKLLYQAACPKTKLHKISTSLLNLRKTEHSLLLIEQKWSKTPSSINLSKDLATTCDPETLNNDSTKISCLNNLLLLLKKFCQLYKDIDCFYEIFQPCTYLLQRLPTKLYPKQLQALYGDIVEILQSCEHTEKIPLTLQARKPVPLPLLEPQFDDNYEVRSKRRAGDKAQNEREKLQYKLKKETKEKGTSQDVDVKNQAATREIRKDAHFLAKEQLKETMERDAGRRRKVKDLQRALENERREIKEMEKASNKFSI